MNPSNIDRRALAASHRIVVKLGTGVITRDGRDMALGRVTGIIEELALLHRQGHQIVLVSSGAVSMGMRTLGLAERPRSLGLRQACAAVGQGHLISWYLQAFAQLGLTAAQVLLTQEDLGDRDRTLCLRTTLMRLLELGTIPVLNENDSVSVRELLEIQVRDGEPTPEAAFGDNDGLSALVALALDADLLLLLTDVDGLHTANPQTDPQAQRIDAMVGVDDLSVAQGLGSTGTGGMASKLQAAKWVTDEGIPAVIAHGDHTKVVTRVVSGEGLGTVIWPSVPRPARARTLSRQPQRGALVVNDGALAALHERKASLLPIGVLAIEGEFARGDLVEIRDRSGRVHGRGLVNYDSPACRAIAGRHSDDIQATLGFRGYDAVITRDNLLLSSRGARV